MPNIDDMKEKFPELEKEIERMSKNLPEGCVAGVVTFKPSQDELIAMNEMGQELTNVLNKYKNRVSVPGYTVVVTILGDQTKHNFKNYIESQR